MSLIWSVDATKIIRRGFELWIKGQNEYHIFEADASEPKQAFKTKPQLLQVILYNMSILHLKCEMNIASLLNEYV